MARKRKTSNIDMHWSEVSGLRETLQGMSKTMRNSALRSATRQVAKMTKEMAVSEAPHDTGQLAASIKVKAARRSRAKNRKMWVGTNVTTEEGLFQGETFYAGFLEFGTDPRVSSKGYRGQIEKNRYSFLRPALLLHEEAKIGVFKRALYDWIAKQRRKGKMA